jgi:hypothetical protein
MPNALTDTNISTTYAGVLHAQGEPIPATGLKVVYDGVGNKSSLSVGREGEGIRVTGTIIADSIAVGSGGLDTSSVQAIVDLIYPVGAIVITIASTPPEYSGTLWQPIAQGKFIAGVGTGSDGSDSVAIAAGDDSNQTNQGKYNVTLDESQMPSHSHGGVMRYPSNGGSQTEQNQGGGPEDYSSYNRATNNAGGDAPHTNIPPWFGAYVWERTS